MPDDARPLTHITRVIEAQGRRLDWLAERAGVGPSYLTHILAGRRRLRTEHAQRIADALGVPVDYILQAPDEPERHQAPAQTEPQEAGV